MKKQFLFFTALSLAATTALAQTAVSIAADGTTVSDATTWTDCTVNVSGSETITFSERITISGSVTLNLGEGATLKASKGIAVHQGNSLTIDGEGALNSYSNTWQYSAIGGSLSSPNCGTITINGGTVYAESWNYSRGTLSAAIGGGHDGTTGGNGTIVINGGSVTTLVSYGGAASIGGANNAEGGNITITGGTVTAKRGGGSTDGAGIGGGGNGNGGNITITGGTVTTNNSGWGAGIGGGRKADGGNITISGGNITAIGGKAAAGIGGGDAGGGAGTITITGGVINATGHSETACIGGTDGGNGGTISISGGQITAHGGYCGIGAGKDGEERTIALSWTNSTDYIDASFNGAVSFANGKRFYYDETEDYATAEGLYRQEKKIVPAVADNSRLSNGEIRMRRSYVTTEGTAVEVSYDVYDYEGNKLALGTDYTAVFKNSSDETVTTLEHLGDYTLTVTGTGTAYTGSLSYTFSLVEWDMALTEDGSEHYVNLPENGTKTVYLNAGQSIKVYDSEGKDGLLKVSDGRLLLHVPEGYALEVTGRTDAMTWNETQQELDNALSAYDDESMTEEIASLVANSANISFASYNNTMLIRLNVPKIYHYTDQYGLDLTVTVVERESHSISKGACANGDISIDKESAYTNETITVTVTPADGYLLKRIDLSNGGTAGETQWYSGSNTVTFRMPNQNITVTPVFTNNLTAEELTIDINTRISEPTQYVIPDGVSSFGFIIPSIRDYNNHTTTSVFLTPDGSIMRLTNGGAGFVYAEDRNTITIYDGASTDSEKLIDVTGQTGDLVLFDPATTSANSMTVHTHQDLSAHYFWLSGTVEVLRKLTAANVADIPDLTYTGSALKPEVNVAWSETVLNKGTDYTVSYTNNTNAGTAQAIVSGIGYYTGTVEKTFTIGKATPLFVALEGQTIACTQSLADVTLPEGYSFADESQTLTAGENSVAVNYTPDADNYEVVSGNMTITVEHSFTNYVYNEDATTEADGTETANCDHGCGTTDTRTAEGTMLPGVVTSLDDIRGEDKPHARKYLEDGRLIIEVGGIRYDTAGRRVR